MPDQKPLAIEELQGDNLCIFATIPALVFELKVDPSQ